jgi:uncharacterized protein
MLGELPAHEQMNVEVLDGYLTALLVGPRLVERLRTREWLPAVWGGDGEGSAPFPSQRQRKRATVLVLRHLQSIACRLRDAPDGWQPVFSVAEVEGRELTDAEDWCIGFLQAVALDPDAWTSFFEGPGQEAAMRPIVALGADESALDPKDVQRLGDAQARDELSRAVIDAVLGLVQGSGGSEDDNAASGAGAGDEATSRRQ